MIWFLVYFLIASLVGCAAYYYCCKEYKKSNSGLTLDKWLDKKEYYDIIAAISMFWIVAVPIVLIIGSISFAGKLIRELAGVE